MADFLEIGIQEEVTLEPLRRDAPLDKWWFLLRPFQTNKFNKAKSDYIPTLSAEEAESIPKKESSAVLVTDPEQTESLDFAAYVCSGITLTTGKGFPDDPDHTRKTTCIGKAYVATVRLSNIPPPNLLDPLHPPQSHTAEPVILEVEGTRDEVSRVGISERVYGENGGVENQMIIGWRTSSRVEKIANFYQEYWGSTITNIPVAAAHLYRNMSLVADGLWHSGEAAIDLGGEILSTVPRVAEALHHSIFSENGVLPIGYRETRKHFQEQVERAEGEWYSNRAKASIARESRKDDLSHFIDSTFGGKDKRAQHDISQFEHTRNLTGPQKPNLLDVLDSIGEHTKQEQQRGEGAVQSSRSSRSSSSSSGNESDKNDTMSVAELFISHINRGLLDAAQEVEKEGEAASRGSPSQSQSNTRSPWAIHHRLPAGVSYMTPGGDLRALSSNEQSVFADVLTDIQGRDLDVTWPANKVQTVKAYGRDVQIVGLQHELSTADRQRIQQTLEMFQLDKS